MNYKHNPVPETLQGKVIAITGTGPGTGKSYSKNYMITSFKSMGYRVEPLGSANKNCFSVLGRGKTLHSYCGWTDFEKCRETKSYTRLPDDKVKIHNKRSAFLFVDEAMMLSQEDIDLAKKQNPKCCIFVIGDANQFSPIADVIEEYYIDEETGQKIAVPDNLCEKIHGSVIRNVDYCFELNKNYRQKNDEDLKRVLKNIKEGITDPHLLYKFIKERYCTGKEQFAICRTNGGIAKWKKSDLEGIYRGLMGNDVVCNSQLFDKDGVNLDNGEQINLNANMFLQDKKGNVHEVLKEVKGVTCHRIQGSTFKKDILTGKVVIDIDDALSIIKDPNNKYQVEDFLRFIYVAISRFEFSNQITFKLSNKNIAKLAEVTNYATPLDVTIEPNETLSSQEFCEKICPSYLEDVLNNVKVYTFPGDFEYIYYNNIYSKLGGKVYTSLSKKIDAYTAANLAYKQGYSRNNKHGISKFLMEIGCNRHKVAGSLDLIFDIIDILSDIEKEEKRENNRTIGDIYTNQVEENLDILVEKEIEKCFYEKDKTMFRELWSKAPSSDRREKFEFIKEMIEKHYTK